MGNTLSQPTVLFISKDIDKIRFLKKILKKNYALLTVEEGEEVFTILKNTLVDIFMLDESIRDISPLELAQKIKREVGYEKAPLLLISNNLKKTFILSALEAGVTDFLNYPLDELEVEQRLAIAAQFNIFEKKMSLMRSKIKKNIALPKANEKLQTRFLLNNQALKEISKAKKEATSLSLLMIELDDYSEIVKKWGNLVGEEIILSLSSLLNRRLRKFDTLYPQGGGRYILLLPKTSQRAAAAIAEDILSEVHQASFSTKKTKLHLTVSIGLFSFDESVPQVKNDYKQFDQMLEKVQYALEKAKKTGNRIVSSH